jgi:hypothetical protein
MILVTTSEWTPRVIGNPHNNLGHALECAKRSVRRDRTPRDVWLCGPDGKKRILLAYVKPGGCTLTNSGHVVSEKIG